MLCLAALSTVFAVAAKATSAVSEPLNHQLDHYIHSNTQEIEVVEANKSYIVNLECVGCPFAVQDSNGNKVWQQPYDNALRLGFTIENVYGARSILLLNGDNILPLDATPPFINAPQIPINITSDSLKSDGYGLLPWDVMLPLRYEHTVLRTQEQGQLWIQFDVTGLPLDQIQDSRYPSLVGEPVILDKREQKLVQLLLQQHSETDELFILDVQVVARADRVQPYRMKCGRLAMIQTMYDPREWDKYGKYGTWARVHNFVLGEVGVWPLVLSLAGLCVLLRRWCQQRQREVTAMEGDAEIALLVAEYEDAPPAYADIPVIKIEEYN